MNPSSESAPPTKPSFLRSLRLVAWGFLGVRRRSEYQRDLAQVASAVCPQCGAKTQGGKFCPECGEKF